MSVGISELVGESHPDFGSIGYVLDANGNRTQRTVGGVTEYLGYDAQNKLLWLNQAGNYAPTPNQAQPYRLYTYDAAGQPTQMEHRDPGQGITLDRYDWDAGTRVAGGQKLRRIHCVGAEQDRYTAEYDGSGTRVSARLNGVDHVYSYGAGLLHDTAGNTVYTPGVSQRQNGADASFHQDWLGSTRYLTDATGVQAPTAYRFDAFGNTSAQAGPDSTSLKFAGAHGYQSDVAMGLQLLGARYYDPAVGRFLNPDPIGYAGGLNLYGYCGGNPVGAVDPTGHDIYVITWKHGDHALARHTGQHAAIGVDADPWHPQKSKIDVFDYNPTDTADARKYIFSGRDGEVDAYVVAPTRLNLAQVDEKWRTRYHRSGAERWAGLSIVRIKADPETTLKVRAFLERNCAGPNISPYGRYNARYRNCANFVRDALNAGGFFPGRVECWNLHGRGGYSDPRFKHYHDQWPTTPNLLRDWALRKPNHEIIFPH